MNSAVILYALLAFAAVFAMITPMNYAEAQSSEPMPDGEGEYKDGEHEGKSCPFKERKGASVNTDFNI